MFCLFVDRLVNFIVVSFEGLLILVLGFGIEKLGIFIVFFYFNKVLFNKFIRDVDIFGEFIFKLF